MDAKGDKSSYNFLTKASQEMGPKRFWRQNFLFIVKFKKLGFSPFKASNMLILK